MEELDEFLVKGFICIIIDQNLEKNYLQIAMFKPK